MKCSTRCRIAVLLGWLIDLDQVIVAQVPSPAIIFDSAITARRSRPWPLHNSQSCDRMNSWLQERRNTFRNDRGRLMALEKLYVRLNDTNLQVLDQIPVDIVNGASPLTPLEVKLVAQLAKKILISHGDDPHKLIIGSRFFSTRAKLLHDLEQMAWLLVHGKLPSCFWGILGAYQDVLTSVQGKNDDALFMLSEQQFEKFGLFYNTLLYVPIIPYVSHVVHEKFDFALTGAQYRRSSPNVVVADNFLSPEALNALLVFTLESTMWFEWKPSYLGAMVEDGYDIEILRQVVTELRDGFGDIIGDLPLKDMWAFKFDHTSRGIPPHADDAQVSVNLWIVPDDANTDPSTGGLVIYTKEPELGFDIHDYNSLHADSKLQTFLASAQTLRIPYRQNRLVMFKSTLLHASEHIKFSSGYDKRRIVLSFLFGQRVRPTALQASEFSEL